MSGTRPSNKPVGAQANDAGSKNLDDSKSGCRVRNQPFVLFVEQIRYNSRGTFIG